MPELPNTNGCFPRTPNSDKPPSTDGPGKKKKRKKTPGLKRQGGQLGHQGKKRELLPAKEMDKIHDIYPGACQHCRRPLDPEENTPSPNPLRHQTFELPDIKPIKEEYRCHTLHCACGHSTTAQLPEEVARSSFGPRVHAAVGWLGTAHRVSKRGVAEIMENLFGIDISTGALFNAAERVSEACEPVTGQIKRYTASAAALNADETGWRCKGQRRYLWTFVTTVTAIYAISPSRSSKVIKEMLGDTFAGVLTSDDHSAYRKYQKNGRRQLCWGHLIRKLKPRKERGDSPDAFLFGKNMLAEAGRMFSIWHAFPESGCSRRDLWLATALVRGRMKRLCLRYQGNEDGEVHTRAKKLLDNWDHLFTFLEVEGVEPTNNAAERALRPYVQMRKLCFGSQSHWGERYAERLFSVIQTCRMQGVNPFHFLVGLMQADFGGKAVPSLPYL